MTLGIDQGSPSFHQVRILPTRWIRNISASPASTDCSPSRVPAITGKTDTMQAATMTLGSPIPNQITSIGAIATSGTIWSRSVSG